PRAPPARGGGRPGAGAAGATTGVLWLRWHVQRQELGRVGGDGRRQGGRRARLRGRGPGFRGHLLPDAHRWPALPGRRTGTRDARGRDSGRPVVSTPSFAGTPPFPVAARHALQDGQLRANLARATTTIQDKRLRVIAELDDWESLRAAGAAIKDDAL